MCSASAAAAAKWCAGSPTGSLWRGWSDETKAWLIVETFALGANVSAGAYRAGMAPSQLFGWRWQVPANGTFASAQMSRATISWQCCGRLDTGTSVA